MYEQDPDVLRWCLYLLHGDISDHTTIENYAIMEHPLREEFSQLTDADVSGSSRAGVEHLQAFGLTQDWESGAQEVADIMESWSSCSSPGDEFYEGEDMPLEVTDFSILDGEVGQRLNQMVPVPHVPRINGEIPSVDEATSDHQRLLQRLRLYDLVELKVEGDGNCQFQAVSAQFYGTPKHHKFVRQEVVNQLKAHPEMYEGYVPMAYGDYLRRMSKSGEWGDHVTLQAAADSYGVKIFILTSFRDTCYIEILPHVRKSNRVISLSFWAEVHYNSVYPEGELPTSVMKKNRWWHFANNY